LTRSGSRFVGFFSGDSTPPIALPRVSKERNERHFKPLFLDVGLVNRMCGLDLVGAEELITVNAGALAEQFVGQQLLCAAPAFEDPQLFYWGREARNEARNANVFYGYGGRRSFSNRY